MEKAKLIINGKEYDVSLTDEQVSEITKPKKRTGFERVKNGKCFWMIDSFGECKAFTESLEGYEIEEYNAANYYSDRSLAEWCNRADTLNRMMRRWAAEHNSKSIDWQDGNQYKWYILYNSSTERLEFHVTSKLCLTGVIYFDSDENAKSACDEFGDEIKWLIKNRPEFF